MNSKQWIASTNKCLLYEVIDSIIKEVNKNSLNLREKSEKREAEEHEFSITFIIYQCHQSISLKCVLACVYPTEEF